MQQSIGVLSHLSAISISGYAAVSVVLNYKIASPVPSGNARIAAESGDIVFLQPSLQVTLTHRKQILNNGGAHNVYGN